MQTRKKNRIKFRSTRGRSKKRMTGGVFDKKFIIVDGTSSSGKTKICSFFSNPKFGFKCIVMDEYTDKISKLFTKTIPNVYMDSTKKNDLFGNMLYKAMVDDAVQAKKAILDDIEQNGLLKAFKEAGKEADVYILVVYAGLKDLARNLNSRRQEGEARGVFAFDQYADRYIKCDNDDLKKIESIQLPEFMQLLKDQFKYEFASEKELQTFAQSTFEKMNIHDNAKHFVKLRDEFICNYFLNTTGKTLHEINQELQTVFSR